MLGNADKEADAMRGMLFRHARAVGVGGVEAAGEHEDMGAVDDFGLGKAELIGWWEAEQPVTLKETCSRGARSATLS